MSGSDRGRLTTRAGALTGPVFWPDATRAVVRSLASPGVRAAGVRALMTNGFHLSTKPGADVVRSLGGLHRFMGFDGPIATDSGGYQIYSLIRENADNGSVSPKGFVFRGGARGRTLFTPDKSIGVQVRLGSDLVYCLDVCTHPDDPGPVQRESVDLTIAWARICRDAFDRRLERTDPAHRPLLFAVVQGGADEDLRRRCVDALVEIGFDGFGYGGWPVADDGTLVDMVARVAELAPPGMPLHGLGIGRTDSIVAAWRAGYVSFDSVLPTRDARRGRLLLGEPGIETGGFDPDRPARYLYIRDDRYVRDGDPIDPACPCGVCERFSRAYLRHLFSIDDGAAAALATEHNLAFYERLMRGIAIRFPREA